MVLRKEEERKQMHNKTGGGVFNLIFRRGKSSMGSGSISSDARSISPTRSDDSRSVTPPNSQKISAPSPPKKDPPLERPKPPQRKRRPAPKPPLPEESSSSISEEKPPGDNEPQLRQTENGITICHSRNSSDSSGYHEASVLSENCNASLPRRTKSAFITPRDVEQLSKMHSQSTTNLSNMSSHSKSTMSLGVTGRKKRAAPPPPPLIRASNPSIGIETPSPVVASQPVKYSLGSHQALDSLLTNSPYPSSVREVENNESKCFGSTDSGIAQETVEKLCHPDELPSPMTPPPPPLLTDDLLCITDSSVVISKDISTKFIPKVSTETNIPEVVAQSPKENTHNINIGESSDVAKLSKNNTLQIIDNSKSINLPELVVQESEVNELDWQYQLPSPPKDFRDSSPVNFRGKINTESHSTIDFKDSVVTSPELFEKLKNIEDLQSEKETVSSEVTSIISEEDKPLLNTLTLENLEKRRSLVYNRELATSLKMTDNIDDNEIKNETFSSSLTKFEKAYVEMQTSSQQKTTAAELKLVRNSSNTLPNFKISTYDRPKQKIKVFEDDTIRSNTDNIPINKGIDEIDSLSTSALKKSYIGRSMENLPSIIKNTDSILNFQKEKDGYSEEYVPVSRSDSFSTENVCPPLRPVSRSKSHLTINAYRFKNNSKEDQVSRSNSLYDVSGLQSLGVMRLIQNKLNTPASSTEKLHTSTTPQENHQIMCSKEPLKKLVPKPDLVDKQNNLIPEKIYKYQGPPSINMGTWSDRPKVPVTVKEDADYKLGNNVSSKLIVNSSYNNVTSNNTLEVRRNNYSAGKGDLNDINKVNDANSNNNVVIKIGSQHPKSISNQRFFGHTTATGYRKPLTNINTNRPTQRPHSIAFDSEFDISRVPVVKSVEFKKSFKDNTSVTKINQEDPNIPQEPVSEVKKISTIYRNTETQFSGTVVNQNGIERNKELKSIFRTNSLKHHMTPVVRGFHGTNNNNIGNNLYPWNSSNTSKNKEKDNFTTNVHVPFSQSNLRKTESNLINDKNIYNKQYREDNSQKYVIDNFHSLPSVNHNTRPNIKPPPPPPFLMPKVTLKPTVVKPVEPVMDQRDQLLAAIRTFGGKKGLRSLKAS